MNALLEIVLILTVPLVGFALCMIVYRSQRTLPFDTVSWQARPGIRWHLIRDLLKTTELQGMSRKDVMALLRNPDYMSDCSLAYYLTGDKFGDKLRIRLNADGVVFKAYAEDGC